jgi:hypothetical protein
MGAHVIDKAQPDHRAANEPAALIADRTVKALDEVHLHDDIIIKVKRVRRTHSFEKELALLSHAASRQVAVNFHLVAVGAEDPPRRLHFTLFRRVFGFRLVGDDHPEIAKRLGAKRN